MQRTYEAPAVIVSAELLTETRVIAPPGSESLNGLFSTGSVGFAL
jgi:hypothetical protein